MHKKKKIKNNNQSRHKYDSNLTKKILIFFIVFICVLTLLIIIFPYFVQNSVIDFVEYDTQVIIGDYVGINLDTDKIYFGTIMPGGFAKREIVISSEKKGKVYFVSSGEISEFIYVDSQEAIVSNNQPRYFTLYVKAPVDKAPGSYSGTLKAYILKNSFFAPLIISENKVPVSGEFVEKEGSAKIKLRIPNMEDSLNNLNNS